MEICREEKIQKPEGGRRPVDDWMAEYREQYRTAVNLVEELKKQELHVSTAESCTGGMIASGIVDVSGASNVFEEGYITYSDRIKEKVLGVKRETLEQYTAVSAQTATEMAAGLQERTGAELAISVTGYAGPEDGEDGTPAGTVYIGVCFCKKTEVRHFLFTGDRAFCRRQAVQKALEFGLERIKKGE